MSAAQRPYQQDGANWIARKLSEPDTRAVFLCDQMGLGKTIQALMAADQLNAQRILVVSPAGARRVWALEIQRWFPHWTNRIVIIEPGVNASKILPLLARDQIIVLLSYDVLSQAKHVQGGHSWTSELSKHHWDLLVCDEAHYLKNPSNRTLAVYGMKGSNEGLHAAAQLVLLMSGTPAPNHVAELWFHIRALWPTVLLVPDRRPNAPKPWRSMSKAEFEEHVTEFRDTQWGRQVLRSKNQAWLRDRLKPYVLRRTKDKVLPELPPLQIQDIPLAVRDELLDSYLTDDARDLARRYLADHAQASDDQFLAQLNRPPSDPDNAPLASLRRQLGEMKVEATVEWVLERLACGSQKIILFGWHLNVLEHLHRRLAEHDPVIVTGQTSPQGRVQAVDLFQTRPSVRVFVGQILAAGTAITLTAATEVAIVEPSWVPGENAQAIDRAHRLGQRDSVLASFLYIPGTLDERIMAVFRRKARDIAELHDEDGNNNTARKLTTNGPADYHLQRQRPADRVRAVAQDG